MPIAPGTRLGPYQVTASLGVGGMGEVYSATDTRLDRTVAIKVLPAALAADPDRRQRFEREAKAIAALNHPHICTLHDVGREAEIDFLVMEHLDGESLQDRLTRGALPLAQALDVAIQVADALARAHRQGITHRDLKPGNIFLTKRGAKLLDFGLAKLVDAVNGQVDPAGLATKVPDSLTAQGTVLGTFHYMSPEQLEGRDADPRSDIWAFGCVVYEMVTGRKAFSGTSHATLSHAILGTEPQPITESLPVAPGSLDHILKRCLAKDPDDRWQTARDVHHELRWVSEQRSPEPAPGQAWASAEPRWRRGVMAAVTLVALASTLAAVTLWLRTRTPAPAVVTRLQLARTPALAWSNPSRPQIGISRDGRVIAFAGWLPNESDQRIFVRPLDAATPRALPGTEGGFDPAFSPDGTWIAYRTLTELFKVPVSGGRPVSLGRMKSAFISQGLSWSEHDWIYYAENVAQDLGGGLFRVHASGGAPEELLSTKGGGVAWPRVIGDGRFVLYGFASSGVPSWDDAQIMVLDTRTGETRALAGVTGASARVTAGGHLLWVQDGRVLAAPLDLGTMTLTGESLEVLDGLQYQASTGTTQWAIADNGTIVYQEGAAPGTTLTWAGADGSAPAFPQEQVYYGPRLAPDGGAIAVEVLGGADDIWVLDLRRGTQTRLSQGALEDETPAWSPDGVWVAWSTAVDERRAIVRKRADGSGAEETLWSGSEHAHVSMYAPDGRSLLFERQAADTNTDIWLLSLDGSGAERLLVGSRFNEFNARLSPDGRWLVYSSDDTGVTQIYVQPFPALDRRYQISLSDGNEAVWSRDGRRLFYRGAGAIWAVSIGPGDTFEAGIPERLFDDSFGNKAPTHVGYDVADDGRFLVLGRNSQQTELMTVVLNWFEELKARVPVR